MRTWIWMLWYAVHGFHIKKTKKKALQIPKGWKCKSLAAQLLFWMQKRLFPSFLWPWPRGPKRFIAHDEVNTIHSPLPCHHWEDLAGFCTSQAHIWASCQRCHCCRWFAWHFPPARSWACTRCWCCIRGRPCSCRWSSWPHVPWEHPEPCKVPSILARDETKCHQPEIATLHYSYWCGITKSCCS